MLTRCTRLSSFRRIQRRHYSEQPPSGVPLNSPDGPTADQMEQWAIKTFKGMSFDDQMKHFKRFMIRDLKVLIVGSDTTALTTALAFSKNGVKAELLHSPLSHLDSTPEMGTIIPINAQRIFGEIQSYKHVSQVGFDLNSLGVTDPSGNLYGTINYSELGSTHGYFAVGVQLRALETAIERLIISDGVKLRRNSTITNFEQRVGKMGQATVKVEFDVGAPGSQFKEKEESEYDLVIISDGYLSKTRELAFPNETIMGATSIRYDAIVKRPNSVPAGLMLDMWGAGRRAGFFSVNPKMVYTYGLTPLPAGLKASELKVKQLDSFVFLDEFKDFSGPWTEVAKSIREKGQIISSLSMATEAKRVTNGRIVLAGNSAHGLGPLLTRGQEIGLGVEDAYFLSQYLCLRTIPIEQGLDMYEKRYQDRIKPIMLQAKREMAGAFSPAKNRMQSFIRDASLKFLFRTSSLTAAETRIIGVDTRRAARSAFASKVAESPELQKLNRDLQFAPMSQRQFAEHAVAANAQKEDQKKK